MSLTPEIPHPPAWQSLTPIKSEYIRLTDHWAATICLAIGQSGGVFKRNTGSNSREGFYYFQPKDGGNDLFLKVISDQRVETQLSANKISEYLLHNHVNVSPLLAAYPRRLNKTHSLLAYPYITGQTSHSTDDEMQLIGKLIANAHQTLQKLPWANNIIKNSRARDAGFRQLRQQYLNNNKRGLLHKWLSATSSDLSQKQAQTLHGDLNLGNIWISELHGAVLLDFEDSLHNYHSPCVDIAMLLERFVLVQHLSNNEKLTRCKILTDSYQKHSKQPLLWHKSLASCLRSLAIRALLLLENANDNNKSEYDKFITLYQYTLDNDALLAQIQGNA